jgi:hypothetical protein
LQPSPAPFNHPGMTLEILYSAHNRILSNGHSPHCSRNPVMEPSNKIVHNASEPSPPGHWGACPSLRTAFPVRHTAEPRDPRSIRRQILRHTRPETHQNLIHSCKEQPGRCPRSPRGGRSAGSTTGSSPVAMARRQPDGATARPGRYAQTRDRTELEHPRYLEQRSVHSRRFSERRSGNRQPIWRRPGSNR